MGWLLVVLVVSGGLAAVLLAFRRWQAHWGASRQEVARSMPGDEWVPSPDYETTRAVTVHARPEDVYPWLVQMGWKRGGLYSYDCLDRLFGMLDHDSVPRVLPELQKLEAGDLIPLKKGSPFPVRALERDSYLVLAGEEGGFRWTWQTALYPLSKDECRFVTRNRATVPRGVLPRLQMIWLDLAAFIMVRKWLLNIRGLAERLAEERRAQLGSA